MAFEVARNISDPYYKALAIGKLARHVSVNERNCVIKDSLDILDEIEFEPNKTEATLQIAARLDNFIFLKTSETGQNLVDDEFRTAMLTGNYKEPVPPGLEKIRSALCTAVRHYEQTETEPLTSNTTGTPREAARQLRRAATLEAECDQLSALQKAAPALTESQMSYALETISDLRRNSISTMGLLSILPHLSDEYLGKAMHATINIRDNGSREKIMLTFLPRIMSMDKSSAYTFLSQTLHAYSKLHRSELLTVIKAFSPAITWLGDEQVIGDSILAIEESGTWWS